MPSVLITGANRGIGLGLVKHLLNQNGPFQTIIATYRNQDTAADLLELGKQNNSLHVLKLDVSDFNSFSNFVEEVESIVGDKGLNVLINNAGVMVQNKHGDFKSVTYQGYLDVFKTNFFAPIFLCQALLPLILNAARNNSNKPMGVNRAAILNMSSLLGSISDNGVGKYWAYRESKTALNQFTRNLAKEFLPQGVVVVVLHPGHVKTDMGGQNGKITVEESVSGLYKLMTSLDESKTDKFFQWDGKELMW